MGGDTQGARDYSDARREERRRRLSHLDDRNTDKYYRSGQVDPFAVPPHPRMPATPEAAYAALQRSQAPKAAPQPLQPLRPLGPTPAARPAGVRILVDSAQSVRPAIDAACARLKAGESDIVVEVDGTVPGLVMRARTELELRVTREEICEDQARDVRFSKAGPAAALGGPPPVSSLPTKKADVPFIGSVEDFLAAPDDDEEEEDATAPPVEAEVPGEEDDGDGFLRPRAGGAG